MLTVRLRILALSLCLLPFSVCTTEAQDLGTSAPSTTLAAPPPACTLPPKDPSVWDRSVTAGFSYTEGNSNTSSLNFNGKLSRDFENNVWNFEADYNYGDSASSSDEPRDETKNDFRAKGEYKRILDDIWFAGFGTAVTHDEIADLRYRLQLNPSLGAYLVRTDDTKFSLEAGPSYVFEEKAGESDDFMAPRIANRLEWKLSETSKLFETTEWLMSIDDSDNYIVNAEAGVEAALTTVVNLVVLVRDAYDNQPAIDRERNDVALITGFKFNL